MLLWFLSFYFFILPLQWALSPFPGIDLAIIRVLTLFIILFWVLVSCLKRRIIFVSSPVLFFVSAFLFIATLSVFWAENQEFALRKAVFLWSFFPLFFVLSSFLGEYKEKKEQLINSLLWGGTALSLIALVQFVSQFIFGVERVFVFWVAEILPFFLGQSFAQSVASYPSLLVNIGGATFLRASSVFPDPHMFSFFVGMLTPFVLSKILDASSQKQWIWKVVFGLFVLSNLLSFSRGGYVALFVGMMIFVLVYFSHTLFTLRKVGFLLVGIGVCIMLSFSPIGERFISTFSLSDGSNSERVKIWKEALGHIENNPFLGVGLGNYPLTVKPTALYREPIYAHNLYLDIALEVGVVGLAFFLLSLGGVLWSVWKKWSVERDILWLAIFSALLIFCVHSFFDTALFSVHVLPLLLFILALGV